MTSCRDETNQDEQALEISASVFGEHLFHGLFTQLHFDTPLGQHQEDFTALRRMGLSPCLYHHIYQSDFQELGSAGVWDIREIQMFSHIHHHHYHHVSIALADFSGAT